MKVDEMIQYPIYLYVLFWEGFDEFLYFSVTFYVV